MTIPAKAITVRIQNNYGALVAVPMCVNAQTFAEMIGTKTLTKRALDSIKRLGYHINILPDVKTLNDLS